MDITSAIFITKAKIIAIMNVKEYIIYILYNKIYKLEFVIHKRHHAHQLNKLNNNINLQNY